MISKEKIAVLIITFIIGVIFIYFLTRTFKSKELSNCVSDKYTISGHLSASNKSLSNCVANTETVSNHLSGCMANTETVSNHLSGCMANTETISNKLDACINAHYGPA